MTRRGQLIERPRRTLGALGLGLCAVAVAVGSGADFSAQSANPSNTFSAGSLSIDNSRDGAAILSADNMKPGAAPKSGEVDIENTGSVAGAFTLSRDQVTNTDAGADNPVPFANKVTLGISDCGSTADGAEPVCGDPNDRTLYLGTLAAENEAIALGTFEPGERHRFWFGGSLGPSVGNEYSGDGSSARFVFDAVQKP